MFSGILARSPVFASINRRFARDKNYKLLYSDFLGEYEKLSHMERISDISRSGSVASVLDYGMTLTHNASASGGLGEPQEGSLLQTLTTTVEFYLPHHGVLRTQGPSSKLWVVFNESSKTPSGTLLNEMFYTGAKLQRDIVEVLFISRQHKFIFITDFAKMFRRIRVHRDDWPLQRILWLDPNAKEVAYNLTTVTYDTRSAPSLSICVLLQLVADEGHKYPLAVDPLITWMIFLGGGWLGRGAQTGSQTIIGLCSAGDSLLVRFSRWIRSGRTHSQSVVA